MAESEPRSPHWRAGVASSEWTDDERAYAVLLDALTRDLLASESAELEMDARARRSMVDVLRDQERIEDELVTESRLELQAFRDALKDARARSASGAQGEASYDSSDPGQDRMAGVLIQYLVRPDYAEVRTEDVEPDRHIYYIRVAWERLEALAEEQGHSLLPPTMT